MRLTSLYDCGCDTCRNSLAAEQDGPTFPKVLKAAENAFKHLHKKGGYQPEDINDAPYKKLAAETYKAFDFTIQDNEVPEEMKQKLHNDAFIFSGLKTHAQLMEATSMLLDENGKVKSYEKFAQEFNKVNQAYNQNYLQAEHQFAVSSSQAAANWAALDPDGRYHLQYRTANDNRVRDSHAILQDTTLPKDDPFWLSYYPPNGWRCRCVAVEVLRNKYPESDSTESVKRGERATTQINAAGKNALEIFRFNPGAEQKVFPPKHPYNKVKGAEEVKEIIKKEAPAGALDLTQLIKGNEPTNAEIKNIMQQFAGKFPENFRSNLEGVKVASSSSYLMQHSMKYSPSRGEWVGGSTISISSKTFQSIDFNPLQELKGAFGAIRNQKQMSFKQEYALESLWHEILHAKTQTKPAKLDSVQVKNMETINEFVARHTYDTFVEQLGGKAAHKEEVLKSGFGYSSWITAFRERLATAEIPEEKAVAYFSKHLMSDYQSLGGKIKNFFNENQKK